jgi:DNA-binding response OmpR family regulator
MKDQPVKVLVLGGDADSGRELLSILGKEGFQAELAHNLASGMSMLDGGMFSACVLDLSTFRGNEVALLTQIHDKDDDLPVIALGDLDANGPEVRSSLGLVSDYLKKPVGKEELVELIRRLSAERGQKASDREDLLAAIGARIRAERKRQELTLKQVAERTRLSVSLLSQIERAESAASVSSLYKIAGALKTPLQSFFEGY